MRKGIDNLVAGPITPYKENMNIQDLLEENNRLKSRIDELECKLAFFENHPSIAQGIKGETLVSRMLNAAISSHNASYDLNVKHKNLLLEIKFSRLNNAVRKRTTCETFRWAWSKPFGESGEKVYDRLILIGEKDERYIDKYKDPSCPYILFDIPYEEIMPLTIQTNAGRYRSIQLTTNPKTARSSASPLFDTYQVKIQDLELRYGV
jgi:hypothetical protein